MKVLVYNGKIYAPGGILTAGSAQILALKSVGIEVTTDPNDTYDLVDINYFMTGAKKVIKKAKKNNIPVVVHAHSTEADAKYSFRIWRPYNRVRFYPLMWGIYKSADFIIPVSNFCKHNLEADLLQWHIPMKVVNNAVDFDYFKPNSDAVKSFYKYFNLSKNDKVVIGLGLPFNRKGIKDFIAVARKMPDVKFIWFGGASKILLQRNVLKAIKNKPENVIMPGYMRNEVLQGALQAANCLFFPTYCENDSIVALEALANKIPFLVRDIGAMEYLEDGKECFKASTNEEFIEKLNYILNNDCSEVVKAGYKKVKQRDLKVIGEQLKAVYEEVLSKRGK